MIRPHWTFALDDVITQSGLVAIETHYLGPTDHRGSRIVATCGSHVDDRGYHVADWRLVVSYDHALDGPDNHASAARAMIAERGWDGVVDGLRWAQGATMRGYCFAPYVQRMPL